MKFFSRYDSYKKNTIILGTFLLVPVIVISVINFFLLFQKNVCSLEQSFRKEAKQKLELLNTNLSPMYRLTDQRRTDERFQTHYLEKEHFSDAYYEITRALQQDTPWTAFFDSVSYYNRKLDKVYTYSSQKSAEEYFGWEDDGRDTYPEVTLEADQKGKDMLEQTGSQIRTFRAGHVAEQRGIIFAVPLEMKQGDVPLSYMIFTVSDKVISNIWDSDNGISFEVFYYNYPVYKSKGGNIDEIFFAGTEGNSVEKEGLKTVFRMNRWYLFQNILPEIIIQTVTTFLILIISLQLLLFYTRKNYEPIRKILNRFPRMEVNKNTLTEEFQYINFVLDDLAASQEILKQENKNMRVEKCLYQLFSNKKLTERQALEKCLEAEMTKKRNRYVCFLADETEPEFDFYVFFETADGTSGKDNDLYFVEVSEKKTLYLLGSDWDCEYLKERLNKLKQERQIIVSEIVNEISNVWYAYQSVSEHFKDTDEVKKDEYPALEMQFLHSAVQNENLEKARFALAVLNENMKEYSEVVKGAVLSAACSIFWNEEADEKLEQLGKLEGDKVGGILTQWLEKRLGRQAEPVRKKIIARNMHTILQYIEEHGASPDFTIKAMASDFGTSASNLGHQFKKSTGQTLSQFIEEWKMQKAKEKLQKGESVSNVAKELGYLTTPAFTEAFKKYMGITPSRYKSGEKS